MCTSCETHVQTRDEPLVIAGVWALLDLVEEEDMMNRLDKVEEKVSRLFWLAALCDFCLLDEERRCFYCKFWIFNAILIGLFRSIHESPL